MPQLPLVVRAVLSPPLHAAPAPPHREQMSEQRRAPPSRPVRARISARARRPLVARRLARSLPASLARISERDEFSVR